jgi:hypothetical protein
MRSGLLFGPGFLDAAKPDRFINYDLDGLSNRIDLNRLSERDRHNALDQLSRVIERLRR